MGAGVFVGRVGGMAVALGIGVAIAAGTGLAVADSSSTDSGPRSSQTSSAPQTRHTPRAAAPKPAPSAAVNRKATPSAAAVIDPLAPDPQATYSTPFGDLGKWMINKNGQVADWLGAPYCTGDVCKTLQEPINTIFKVKASSKFQAEVKLNRSLRKAGFPALCCSSVGYQGIVDQVTFQQAPRSGILGVLLGVGAAYRDASFLAANSHLRTFGGAPDGNGNYIFTASVSKESLGQGLTHAYESFDQARAKLLGDMVAAGAQNLGVVPMMNAIPADDPTYTTADHDGYAQVIGLGTLAGMAWRAPNPG